MQELQSRPEWPCRREGCGLNPCPFLGARLDMRTLARPGPTALPYPLPALARLLAALLGTAAFSSPAALAAPDAARKPPSLEERILAEVESPRALADLYRLYERRDRTRDLSGIARTLDQVAS